MRRFAFLFLSIQICPCLTFRGNYDIMSIDEKSRQIISQEVNIMANWNDIKSGAMEGFLPTEKGTYHTMKELHAFMETHPFSWQDIIAEKKRQWNK